MDYLEIKYIRHSELYHYGVKGQKWGILRYQNADGSLTEEGLKRYNSAKGEGLTYQEKYKGMQEKAKLYRKDAENYKESGQYLKALKAKVEANKIDRDSQYYNKMARDLSLDYTGKKSLEEIRAEGKRKVAGATIVGALLGTGAGIMGQQKIIKVPAKGSEPGSGQMEKIRTFKTTLLSDDAHTRHKSWGKVLVSGILGGLLGNAISKKKNQDVEKKYLQQK